METDETLTVQMARHRWPLLIMTGLVVVTLFSCILMLSTTSLLAKPELTSGAQIPAGTEQRADR
ncbi:MAG: hypothetical protein AAFQ54_03475 [Pseudomonadota bacterium]